MRYETDRFRLEWTTTDDDESLILTAEQKVDGEWIDLMDGPQGTQFPKDAPEACQRGALEAFAAQLEEARPGAEGQLIRTLTWTELSDKDMLQRALEHVGPDAFGAFLYDLFGLNGRAGVRAIDFAGEDLMGGLTEDDVVRLVRHENTAARADALRALRTHNTRLTGLKR